MQSSKHIHQLVLAALFTAIAIMVPFLMPKLYMDGVFTATLAAHTPIVLAMFIAPWMGAAVSAGSAIGFCFAMNPIIGLRAAMHIPFALLGGYMIQKKQPMWLTFIVTAAVHAGLEALVVWLLYVSMGIDLKGLTLNYTMGLILIGTALHYLIDFALALIIYKPLEKPYFNKLR